MKKIIFILLISNFSLIISMKSMQLTARQHAKFLSSPSNSQAIALTRAQIILDHMTKHNLEDEKQKERERIKEKWKNCPWIVLLH